MFRVFFATLGAFAILFQSGSAFSQESNRGTYSSASGQCYQIPTPGRVCNTNRFSVDGLSVVLCTDSLGLPLKASCPLSGISMGRSPASTLGVH